MLGQRLLPCHPWLAGGSSPRRPRGTRPETLPELLQLAGDATVGAGAHPPSLERRSPPRVLQAPGAPAASRVPGSTVFQCWSSLGQMDTSRLRCQSLRPDQGERGDQNVGMSLGGVSRTKGPTLPFSSQIFESSRVPSSTHPARRSLCRRRGEAALQGPQRAPGRRLLSRPIAQWQLHSRVNRWPEPEEERDESSRLQVFAECDHLRAAASPGRRGAFRGGPYCPSATPVPSPGSSFPSRWVPPQLLAPSPPPQPPISEVQPTRKPVGRRKGAWHCSRVSCAASLMERRRPVRLPAPSSLRAFCRSHGRLRVVSISEKASSPTVSPTTVLTTIALCRTVSAVDATATCAAWSRTSGSGWLIARSKTMGTCWSMASSRFVLPIAPAAVSASSSVTKARGPPSYASSIGIGARANAAVTSRVTSGTRSTRRSRPRISATSDPGRPPSAEATAPFCGVFSVRSTTGLSTLLPTRLRTKPQSCKYLQGG
eukprot:scaffold367_cov254-Pinguiococcus_pyrenoidosus.AAC.3